MYEVCISCPKLGKPCNGPNFSALSTPERLEWIKKRKNFLGWSNAKLAEESNTPKGTIDSLLSGNRTGANTETLRPIFEALIGGYTDGKPCPNPPTEEDVALEDKVHEQEETICALQKELAKNDDTIRKLEDEVNRLKNHIKHADELHVKDKENAVSEYKNAYMFHRKLAAIFAAFLIVAIILIFAALFIDKIDPHKGFLWIEQTAAFFGSQTNGLFEHAAQWMKM